MNILRRIFLLISLFVCSHVFAQVYVADGDTVSSGIRIFVSGDGAGVLAGASVELMSQTDTLRGVTNSEGDAVFPNSFGRDTITMKVSFLGYADVVHKMCFENPYTSPMVMVNMQEEKTLLNAIIIQDNAVAMVVHGDTTIYNASAFKTRKRDPLKKLLEKIPGINIGPEGIIANGEKVGKILINGTTLFGNNIDAAMNLMYCDDIKKVRVYDEHDQDRLIEADTLGMKERVLDVVTNRSITAVKAMDLGLSAGLFTDMNAKGKLDWLAGVISRYNKFKNGRRDFLNLQGEKNMDNSLASSEPSNKIHAQYSVDGERKSQRKSKYRHSVNVKYTGRISETSAKDVYTTSESYRSRISDYHSLAAKKSVYVSYGGYEDFAVNERSTSGFEIGANYSGEWSDLNNRTDAAVDGVKSVTDVRTFSRNNKGLIYGTVYYKKIGKKKERLFYISGSYSGNFGRGDGSRKDDDPESVEMQFLTDSSSLRKQSVLISANYSEPLSDLFRFSVKYNGEGIFSFSEKLSWDELLSCRDLINTHSFTHNDINNSLFAGFSYNNRAKGLYIQLGGEYKNIWQIRKESLPENLAYPDCYHHIHPSFHLRYNKNLLNIAFNYNEVSRTPSIEQKREVINDSNPLFLTVGNSALKLPVARTFDLDANLVSSSISTTWRVKAQYVENSNDIVNRTVYFPESTILEQYAYTAPAGSELIIPENVKDSRTFSGTVGSDIFSAPLRSTFSPSVSYNYFRRPFFMEESRYDNIQHEMDLSLSYRSSFSKYFEFRVSNDTGLGTNLRSGEKVYDYVNENLSASASVDFLNRFRISAGFTYVMMKTSTGVGGYERTGLDASFVVYFGDKRRNYVSLNGYDLLGRNNNRTVSVTDYYVSSRYSSIFGRSVVLCFYYDF